MKNAKVLVQAELEREYQRRAPESGQVAEHEQIAFERSKRKRYLAVGVATQSDDGIDDYDKHNDLPRCMEEIGMSATGEHKRYDFRQRRQLSSLS